MVALTDFKIPSSWDTFGPIACGVILGVFGCGVLLAQTLTYFDRTDGDSWNVRALLLVSLGLNIVQTACDCSRLLKILVVHTNNLAYFIEIKSRPEELICPLLGVIISAVCQGFLAQRCLQFARLTRAPQDRDTAKSNVHLYGLAILLISGVILSLGAGIATAVELWTLPSLIYASRQVAPHSTFVNVGIVWLSLSTITDIILASLTCYELLGARSKRATGQRLTSTLIRIAFPSGFIVSGLQITTLVLFVSQDNTPWADFAMIFISKVYGITLASSVTLPREALKNSTPGLEVAITSPADRASFFAPIRSLWPGQSRDVRDDRSGTDVIGIGHALALVSDEKGMSVRPVSGIEEGAAVFEDEASPSLETFGQVLAYQSGLGRHGHVLI